VDAPIGSEDRASFLIPGRLGLFTTQPDDHRYPEASGSVNRSFSPESVRYLSVTSVVRRHLLTDDDRRWHNARRPASTGKPPLTGRLCRWWQVQGSNLG